MKYTMFHLLLFPQASLMWEKKMYLPSDSPQVQLLTLHAVFCQEKLIIYRRREKKHESWKDFEVFGVVFFPSLPILNIIYRAILSSTESREIPGDSLQLLDYMADSSPAQTLHKCKAQFFSPITLISTNFWEKNPSIAATLLRGLFRWTISNKMCISALHQKLFWVKKSSKKAHYIQKLKCLVFCHSNTLTCT